MAKKLGRPTSWKEEYVEQARKLSLLGLTDVEMAQYFEIATSTLYEWKKEKPRFSEALKNGKAIADAEVAEKLYKRALGFSKHISTQTENGQMEKEQYFPPDVTAIIYWLKNRQPEKWRDKQEIEHSGEVSDKTKEYLEKMSDVSD